MPAKVRSTSASRLASRVLGAVLATALLLAASRAGADARTEARSHFKKGMDAIAAGRYDEGIADLQEAYQLLPHPSVLYNIARAYAEAGELDEAVVYFRKYLEGNPADKVEASQILKNLEARIKRQQQAAHEAAQTQTPSAAPPQTNPPGGPPTS